MSRAAVAAAGLLAAALAGGCGGGKTTTPPPPTVVRQSSVTGALTRSEYRHQVSRILQAFAARKPTHDAVRRTVTALAAIVPPKPVAALHHRLVAAVRANDEGKLRQVSAALRQKGFLPSTG